MRKRFISSSKPKIESRKVLNIITKEFPADKYINRPRTASLQPDNINS